MTGSTMKLRYALRTRSIMVLPSPKVPPREAAVRDFGSRRLEAAPAKEHGVARRQAAGGMDDRGGT